MSHDQFSPQIDYAKLFEEQEYVIGEDDDIISIHEEFYDDDDDAMIDEQDDSEHLRDSQFEATSSSECDGQHGANGNATSSDGATLSKITENLTLVPTQDQHRVQRRHRVSLLQSKSSSNTSSEESRSSVGEDASVAAPGAPESRKRKRSDDSNTEEAVSVVSEEQLDSSNYKYYNGAAIQRLSNGRFRCSRCNATHCSWHHTRVHVLHSVQCDPLNRQNYKDCQYCRKTFHPSVAYLHSNGKCCTRSAAAAQKSQADSSSAQSTADNALIEDDSSSSSDENESDATGDAPSSRAKRARLNVEATTTDASQDSAHAAQKWNFVPIASDVSFADRQAESGSDSEEEAEEDAAALELEEAPEVEIDTSRLAYFSGAKIKCLYETGEFLCTGCGLVMASLRTAQLHVMYNTKCDARNRKNHASCSCCRTIFNPTCSACPKCRTPRPEHFDHPIEAASAAVAATAEVVGVSETVASTVDAQGEEDSFEELEMDTSNLQYYSGAKIKIVGKSQFTCSKCGLDFLTSHGALQHVVHSATCDPLNRQNHPICNTCNKQHHPARKDHLCRTKGKGGAKKAANRNASEDSSQEAKAGTGLTDEDSHQVVSEESVDHSKVDYYSGAKIQHLATGQFRCGKCGQVAKDKFASRNHILFSVGCDTNNYRNHYVCEHCGKRHHPNAAYLHKNGKCLQWASRVAASGGTGTVQASGQAAGSSTRINSSSFHTEDESVTEPLHAMDAGQNADLAQGEQEVSVLFEQVPNISEVKYYSGAKIQQLSNGKCRCSRCGKSFTLLGCRKHVLYSAECDPQNRTNFPTCQFCNKSINPRQALRHEDGSCVLLARNAHALPAVRAANTRQEESDAPSELQPDLDVQLEDVPQVESAHVQGNECAQPEAALEGGGFEEDAAPDPLPLPDGVTILTEEDPDITEAAYYNGAKVQILSNGSCRCSRCGRLSKSRDTAKDHILKAATCDARNCENHSICQFCGAQTRNLNRGHDDGTCVLSLQRLKKATLPNLGQAITVIGKDHLDSSSVAYYSGATVEHLSNGTFRCSECRHISRTKLAARNHALYSRDCDSDNIQNFITCQHCQQMLHPLAVRFHDDGSCAQRQRLPQPLASPAVVPAESSLNGARRKRQRLDKVSVSIDVGTPEQDEELQEANRLKHKRKDQMFPLLMDDMSLGDICLTTLLAQDKTESVPDLDFVQPLVTQIDEIRIFQGDAIDVTSKEHLAQLPYWSGVRLQTIPHARDGAFLRCPRCRRRFDSTEKGDYHVYYSVECDPNNEWNWPVCNTCGNRVNPEAWPGHAKDCQPSRRSYPQAKQYIHSQGHRQARSKVPGPALAESGTDVSVGAAQFESGQATHETDVSSLATRPDSEFSHVAFEPPEPVASKQHGATSDLSEQPVVLYGTELVPQLRLDLGVSAQAPSEGPACDVAQSVASLSLDNSSRCESTFYTVEPSHYEPMEGGMEPTYDNAAVYATPQSTRVKVVLRRSLAGQWSTKPHADNPQPQVALVAEDQEMSLSISDTVPIRSSEDEPSTTVDLVAMSQQSASSQSNPALMQLESYIPKVQFGLNMIAYGPKTAANIEALVNQIYALKPVVLCPGDYLTVAQELELMKRLGGRDKFVDFMRFKRRIHNRELIKMDQVHASLIDFFKTAYGALEYWEASQQSSCALTVELYYRRFESALLKDVMADFMYEAMTTPEARIQVEAALQRIQGVLNAHVLTVEQGARSPVLAETPQSAQKRQTTTRKRSKKEQPSVTYCICRSREEEGDYIQCEQCSNWFHYNCIGMSFEEFKQVSQEDSDSFTCPYCLGKRPITDDIQSMFNPQSQQDSYQSQSTTRESSKIDSSVGNVGSLQLPPSRRRGPILHSFMEQYFINILHLMQRGRRAIAVAQLEEYASIFGADAARVLHERILERIDLSTIPAADGHTQN